MVHQDLQTAVDAVVALGKDRAGLQCRVANRAGLDVAGIEVSQYEDGCVHVTEDHAEGVGLAGLHHDDELRGVDQLFAEQLGAVWFEVDAA